MNVMIWVIKSNSFFQSLGFFEIHFLDGNQIILLHRSDSSLFSKRNDTQAIDCVTTKAESLRIKFSK